MRRSSVLTGVLVGGAVTVASLFAAAPASAATLPDGQKITIVEQYSDQSYEASPVDASLTAVGTPPDLIEQCATSVDVDDNGAGYLLASVDTVYCSGVVEVEAAIYPYSAVTGLIDSAGGVEISILVDVEFTLLADECNGIDYTAGVVTIGCQIYGDNEYAGLYIGTVDPATGLLTPFMYSSDNEYLTALAINPVTGLLHAFTAFENTGSMWTVTMDGLSDEVELDAPAWGADFDRGGQLWVTSELGVADSVYAALATVLPTDGSNPFAAVYNIGGVPVAPIFTENGFFSAAITVWGLPVLAATGASDLSAPAAAAALLVLAGAILAAVTVLRRRRLELDRG